MKRFVIDSAYSPKAYASNQDARGTQGVDPFGTEKEFASVAAEWTMLRLVAIWNNLNSGVSPNSSRNGGPLCKRILLPSNKRRRTLHGEVGPG